MQLQSHRSRMHRTARGKRIEITARDLEIFALLRRYRYLRSTYIHAFVGGASQTRLKERLGNLFHEGYLNRPSQQWEFADARYSPAVYEFGAGAGRLFQQVGRGTVNAVTSLTGAAHRQFLHSLMICEILASIELAAKQLPSLRFISWPEILARAPEATRAAPAPLQAPLPSGRRLIPDGMFGLEYSSREQKAYRFFALEADRGTMPIKRRAATGSSLIGKIDAYREFLTSGGPKLHWGVPNLLVLTVALDGHRISELTSRIAGPSGQNAVFLFQAISARDLNVPMEQFLTAEWIRAGHQPLQIDR